MLTVLEWVNETHDMAVMWGAAAICAVGSWTALRVYARANASSGIERAARLCIAALVAGATTWTTHFLVLFSSRIGAQIGLDPLITAASLPLAVICALIGLVLAGMRLKLAPALGGAIIGLSLSAIHYAGLFVYRIEAHEIWNNGLLGASIAVASLLCALALHLAAKWPSGVLQHVPTGLLCLAIFGTHFIGLSVFEAHARSMATTTLAPQTLQAVSLATSCLALLVFGAGIIVWRVEAKTAQKAKDAVDNMTSGLLMLDPNGRIELFNKRVAELFRLAPDQIEIGMELSVFLRHVGTVVGWYDARIQKVTENHFLWLEQRQSVRIEHYFDDNQVLSVFFQPLDTGGAIISYDDITELRHGQKTITHMAFHDALTGLPNRRSFSEHLMRLEGRADFSMLMIDLDNFKLVNDRFGHAAGDALLIEVARRLRVVCQEPNLLFRLGGDEMAVLSLMSEADSMDLAEAIVASLTNPVLVEQQLIPLGCSVGIARSGHGGAADMVQRKADLALYQAKSVGRGRVVQYQDGLIEDAEERAQMQVDLETALESKQFSLVYQPIFSITTRKLIGFEALIRWLHPTKGVISPALFIPVAEQSGAIVGIGAWVINEACRQLKQWPDSIRMALNVSPKQLEKAEILQAIVSALDQNDLQPNRLEIELTETALVENSQGIASVLSSLRTLGIRIAMDDFGTGYSSLVHLRNFEIDRIKIDRSFVASVGEDRTALAVIHAITGLAQELGMETTAEGVETAEQLDTLVRAGCSAAQGYLLGRPLDAQAATRLAQQSQLPEHAPCETLRTGAAVELERHG